MNKAVESIQKLLALPEVREASFIELSICDAVHFRLVAPHSIFELTELKLRQRNNPLFAGYAEIRNEIEESMPGTPINDKINACCTRRPEWVNERYLMYAIELEVWMDNSYPNPWAYRLYHEALVIGKSVSIPKLGPFTDRFHQLLKEKNGYERTTIPGSDSRKVRIHVGEQSNLDEPYLYLESNRWEDPGHPFANRSDLGSQLAYGILVKHMDEISCSELNENIARSQMFGYNLIGPLILLLIQEFAYIKGPIAFVGLGSLLMVRLAEYLRHSWPHLPDVCLPKETDLTFSILPEEKAYLSLLSASPGGDPNSVISFDEDVPRELVHPALREFLVAALMGPEAPRIQQAVIDFILDFALMTRGLRLQIPSRPILQHVCRQALSPDEDFLHWADMLGFFPELSQLQYAWNLKDQLERNPWPTGAYLMSKPSVRWWMRRRSPELVKRIEEARQAYT